jgi:hypothetical protein
MLTRERKEAGHTSKLTVCRAAEGWEIREERDEVIVRVTRRTDWHGVERWIERFERFEGPEPNAA